MQSERGIDLLHLSPLHQANQTLPTQAWDEFGPTRKEVLPALLFYRLGFLLFVWGMRLYFPETLFLSHNFWLTGYVRDFFFFPFPFIVTFSSNIIHPGPPGAFVHQKDPSHTTDNSIFQPHCLLQLSMAQNRQHELHSSRRNTLMVI